VAIYGRDSLTGYVAMPLAGQTVNGAPFSVPKGAFAMTIHCPTLAGGPATLTIQALDPDTDQASETWRTISAATGVTLVPLTAIAASGIAITYQLAQIGGGVLRFVASADQSAAPITIKVSFHMLP
jgi:hypothetical protein